MAPCWKGVPRARVSPAGPPLPPAPSPRNPTVDFRGERRPNATHRSTTDPDVRLARKAKGHETRLSYQANVLLDNRYGLPVDPEVTEADDGHGEHTAAFPTGPSAPAHANLHANTHCFISLLVAVATLVGAGCGPGLDPLLETGRELPLEIVVRIAQSKLGDPNMTITVDLRNRGTEPVVLRVACTVIEIDQDQNGTWQRLGDLRLCAPPNQETLRAGATLTTTDQRSLSPGRYRVAIEATDGRTAVSQPFTVLAIK